MKQRPLAVAFIRPSVPTFANLIDVEVVTTSVLAIIIYHYHHYY